MVADDLPGHGRDCTPAGMCTLDAYVERVCSTVESASTPAVLVGHSMGGIVVSGVAERLPKKVAKLVYLAGYLLRDGESIGSFHGTAAESGSLVGQNMVPIGDGSTVGIREEALRETFFDDASADDERTCRTLIRPEPTAAFSARVRVTASRFGGVPRAYIRTTRDRALTPTLQAAMLAATPCAQVVNVDTSHCPMFAAPDRLATILQNMSR